MDQYIDGRYATVNPTWHAADSGWKAEQVLRLLGADTPRSVCEVGCGAGGVLQQLSAQRPTIQRFVGYEIAPAALTIARQHSDDRIEYRLADAAEDLERFDLMLVIDVIEHVDDPIAFLRRLRFKAARTILHIPLDLSVQALLRPSKLIALRNSVGHIHYFTPETALATITDAGYTVRTSTYTRSFDLKPGSQKARIIRIARRSLPTKVTVRWLGGYSLLVDADN